MSINYSPIVRELINTNKNLNNKTEIIGFILLLSKWKLLNAIFEERKIADIHILIEAAVIQYGSEELKEMWRLNQHFFTNANRKSIDEILLIIKELKPEYELNELYDYIVFQETTNWTKFEKQSIQPKEITNLIISLYFKSENGLSIYNPFAGLASYGIKNESIKYYYGQEINGDAWRVGKIRLLLNDYPNFDYECDDSLYHWNPRQEHYDIIVSTPPFAPQYDEYRLMQYSYHDKVFTHNVESFFFSKGLLDLNDRGTIIGVVRAGFLYEGSYNSTNFRKGIVEENLIDTIILLPTNLYYNTTVPSAIVVLKKCKKDKLVKMVDASSFYTKNKRMHVLDYNAINDIICCEDKEYVHLVSQKDIEEKAFSLLPSQYFTDTGITSDILPEGAIIKKLSDVASTFNRMQAYQSSGRLVNVKDLSSDPYNYEKDVRDFEIGEIKDNFQQITSPVLLLSKIRNLKPTFCVASYEAPIFCSPNLIALKVDDSQVDIEYLVYELHNGKFIKSIVKGSVIPSMRIDDIMSLNIVLPPLHTQKVIINRIRNEHRLALVKEMRLEDLIGKQKQEFIEELRIKKHNLTQYLGNMINNVHALSKYLTKQGYDQELISTTRGISIANHINELSLSISRMGGLLEQLTKEYVFGEPEKINLDSVLKRYENNPLYTKCRIEYNMDNSSIFYNQGNGNGFFSPIVEIAEQDLQEIIEHIIANAIKHGFDNLYRDDYVIQINLSLEINDNMYVIEFRNNGKPMPKGMDTHRYGIKGEKGGPTGNDGIGGFRVKSIVEHFHGSYEIIDDEDSLFPVSIIIKLPKVDINENI